MRARVLLAAASLLIFALATVPVADAGPTLPVGDCGSGAVVPVCQPVCVKAPCGPLDDPCDDPTRPCS